MREVDEICNSRADAYIMKLIGKWIALLLVALVVSAVSVEAYVRLYTLMSGVSRQSLQDDYGMAFYAVLIAVLVFVAVILIGSLKIHNASRESFKLGNTTSKSDIHSEN